VGHGKPSISQTSVIKVEVADNVTHTVLIVASYC
jgi:hypothetical protein